MGEEHHSALGYTLQVETIGLVNLQWIEYGI